MSRGHQTQVISFRRLYPRLLFPGTTEIDNSDLKFDAHAQGVLTGLNPLTWLRAHRLIKAFSPDAAVFQWWQPFFGPMIGTLARALRRSGVKCIIECHNVLPHERSPVDCALTKFGLAPADHLITHSEKDRDLLQSILPGRDVSVSPLPALREFSLAGPASRSGRTILFFGKVRKYKGLEVLLAAMPRVLERLECRLLVVGEFYDPVEKYRELIREYGIGSHVQIDDRYVPNEEVPNVFRKADLLVLPYVSASQSAVARIALSNGLPIIASRVGGLAETIEENATGLLFPPCDADALADQIVHYFTAELGPVFSENIRMMASKHPGCRIADIIEQASCAR